MATTIKVTYENETRRVSLPDAFLTFSNFVATVSGIFPKLAGKVVVYVWVDEDGDEITVSSDVEFEEAVRFMNANNNKLLRFEIRLAPSPFSTTVATLLVEEGPTVTAAAVTTSVQAQAASVPAAPGAVHETVRCDECNMFPISGIRYKCTVREDLDLCATCEAKKEQPHPMIKIVNPAHAPFALFCASRDQEEGGVEHGHGSRGVHGHPWRRGFGGRVGPPGGPPLHHGHPQGPSHHHGHPHYGPNGRRFRAFGEPPMPPAACYSSFPSSIPGPAEATTTTTTAAVAAASPVVDAEVPSRQSLPEKIVHLRTQPPPSSVPVVPLPKPALRFVKDLSFPDGSSVFPHSVFRKAWKVRNDGTVTWPEGCVLVNVGGDQMCSESLKVPLPALTANEEAEVAIQLLAPENEGLYTSYFRAQTSDGQLFGHRLWAAILVVATTPGDWHVLSPPQSLTVVEEQLKVDDEVAEAMNVSAAVVGRESTQTATAAFGAFLPVTPELSYKCDAALSAFVPASAPAVPVSVPPSLAKEEEFPEIDQPLSQLAPPPATPVAAPAAAAPQQKKPLHVLWRRELEVLADMGFTDAEVNLPFLQQHLVTPVALSPDRNNAAPSVDGMQRVVSALLGIL